MERIHQIVDNEGIRIPLPYIQRYGLRPGADFVLEMEENGIRILPMIPGQDEDERLSRIS